MEMIVTRFLQISCVVLGALTGCLIGIPLAVQSGSASGIWIVFSFSALGGLIGYRRRTSRAFLYFCLGAVLILSSLVSFSLIVPGK